ncbi:PH and SEC7 domain-containing protein [Ixodes scapularis]
MKQTMRRIRGKKPEKLRSVEKQRRTENVAAFTRVVGEPLRRAKQIILLSADKFGTEFTLRSFIMDVCLLQLGDGKPKFWQQDLKRNIVNNFMNSDPELRQRIDSIKGFCNEFARVVAEEYLKFFDFNQRPLDAALRMFLHRFCLIGETQERERVLVHFSKRYLDANPGAFKSQDAVHTLTCALMLLNTDLHGENIGHKMTCLEFVENLAELNEGENFPKDVLKALYMSIKTAPLEWAVDDSEQDGTSSQDNQSNASEARPAGFIGHNPFLEVPNPNCATEYKKGYVMRKCCLDPGGKRTPLGKRGWKMFCATLRDLVLYLHKKSSGGGVSEVSEAQRTTRCRQRDLVRILCSSPDRVN